MRYFLFILLTLGLVGGTSASNTSSTAETGSTSCTFTKIFVPSDPGIPDGREGGETAEDAFVIAALPFSDTGNTSDNINDYDEVCPYTGSLSPDVVYVWTAAMDGAIDIDMCESGYDTKLYIYENAVTPGDPYACNDDADCDLAYRSALLGVPVTGGNSYYIVVDGYGSDMGDYIFTMNECPPPPPPGLDCPAGGVLEGEPVLEAGYVDHYNGGCNSNPYVFQVMNFPVLCGKSGWYPTYDSKFRDTDWFPVIADPNGYITASCVAVFDCYLSVLLPVDCNNYQIVYEIICQHEIPGTLEFAHPTGTEVWFRVSPVGLSGFVGEFDYILELSGISYWGDKSAIDDVSWGEVKKMFK